MNAWWRCTAVAARGAGAQLSVRVRYAGYEDTEDEEWRAMCDLRRGGAAEAGLRSGAFASMRRCVGEAVEVSAKPTDGHPAALWEASVAEVTEASASIQVGAAVLARWLDGRYYPASIAALLPDGCYRVHFDDGDVAPSVPPQVESEVVEKVAVNKV